MEKADLNLSVNVYKYKWSHQCPTMFTGQPSSL